MNKMTWAHAIELGILSDEASAYFEALEAEARAKESLTYEYRRSFPSPYPPYAVQLQDGVAIGATANLYDGAENEDPRTWRYYPAEAGVCAIE